MELNHKIAVIGLGYVGLPLAVEFAKKYRVIGFDINPSRVQALMNGHDHTMEIEDADLKKVLTSKSAESGLYCTDKCQDIEICTYFIITVPTPTDKHNHPDLGPLYRASETVGRALKKGDIVIYESTVYPGVTEEECAPVLERMSKLKFNVDFFAVTHPNELIREINCIPFPRY
jgi:UDP-N-acetyl-D-galactosamine dehydrogenase